MGKWRVLVLLCLLWILSGGVLALWPPPSISWDAFINWLGMFSMIGGRFGAMGLTNGTETLIWSAIIAISALLVAFFAPRHPFFTGSLLGIVGGGIAAFLQLYLSLHGELSANQSWLVGVPLQIFERDVQLGLTPFAGITRGLLIGIVATIFARFVPQPVQPITEQDEQSTDQAGLIYQESP